MFFSWFMRKHHKCFTSLICSINNTVYSIASLQGGVFEFGWSVVSFDETQLKTYRASIRGVSFHVNTTFIASKSS